MSAISLRGGACSLASKAQTWRLAGPRGMAPGVVAVLHDAFKKALFDPRFGEELARYDQEIAYLGPEDYAQACRDEYAKERAAAERMKASRGASS